MPPQQRKKEEPINRGQEQDALARAIVKAADDAVADITQDTEYRVEIRVVVTKNPGPKAYKVIIVPV